MRVDSVPDPSFAQQTLYLYKLFIAHLWKQGGEGEEGCFCTRVGGEGASFEERICSSGWLASPAGGRRGPVQDREDNSIEIRCALSNNWVHLLLPLQSSFLLVQFPLYASLCCLPITPHLLPRLRPICPVLRVSSDDLVRA